MKNSLLPTLVVAMLLVACVPTTEAFPEADERGRLSTMMVNLSSAVDTYFGDLATAPVDDDETILINATRHDPRLLADDFEPYLLRVQYQDPYGVVLLCTKDGARAIMEDAGCSARLDRQVTGEAPCEFVLRVGRGCAVEGAD